MNGNPIEPPSGSEDSSHDASRDSASAFVIPDDARELARDVEAWRRE
jgi:hypothetical protein